MAPNGVPHLQLPTLTPLEPLTSGTNLPHVPASELTPIEEFKPPPTPTTTLDASTTPPQSPGRPTSMRRFLSRVSLNSSYTNNGDEDDKTSVLSSPLSPTTSVMSRDSKRKTSGSKKSSWWKKSKDKKDDKIQEKNMPPPPLSPPSHIAATSHITPRFDEKYIESAQNPVRKTVQSIAPPPRLPDDLFGSGFSSLDSDMFKDFK